MRRAVWSFTFTHFVRMLSSCRTRCVRICASISVMMEAKARAADGLDAARALWDDTGLTEGMRDLVREVWTTNLERHEPEELGDSARTLGFLCYENLSARTGLDGVKAVMLALTQAEKYGTPLGQSLRVMAQENRDIRMNEAEKKAAALPPKLTVPMILFFLPVLFGVILGPAVIRLMAQGIV